MPKKRAILAARTRDELCANVDCFELNVDDRRIKAQLVDALVRYRRARLDWILQDLPRNRLKDLCRAFHMERSPAPLGACAGPAIHGLEVGHRQDGYR